ncbi:hypothetical protein PORY_001368 [Pneumocystis oryctolagi]|uniref:Uncharacterized protein n=1 Tax=Pneumocystis oryctolagi TaxID=42067 RepID=A0ACB7CE16_9ASCO|nr:hypothetical protein PORY_001368 [Pneumocystis oryctolagi]
MYINNNNDIYLVDTFLLKISRNSVNIAVSKFKSWEDFFKQINGINIRTRKQEEELCKLPMMKKVQTIFDTCLKIDLESFCVYKIFCFLYKIFFCYINEFLNFVRYKILLKNICLLSIIKNVNIGHSYVKPVLKVLFMSCGQQIISSGSDGLVKLWTIKTNECVTTLDNHTDSKQIQLNLSEQDELFHSGKKIEHKD